jgi:hypothetical protein
MRACLFSVAVRLGLLACLTGLLGPARGAAQAPSPAPAPSAQAPVTTTSTAMRPHLLQRRAAATPGRTRARHRAQSLPRGG